MSLLKVNEIRDRVGTGSPNFSNGIGGKIITLADDATRNVDTIFLNSIDGEYTIMQTNDCNMFGVFMYKKGTPSSYTIVSGNPNFVSGDVDAKLCLVVSGNDILVKNRLGSSLDFTFHRRTV